MSFRPDATIQFLIGQQANGIVGSRSFTLTVPSSGTMNVFGSPSGANNIGTITTPKTDLSQVNTSFPYINIVTLSAAAGQDAGHGIAGLHWGRGSASGCGGFRFTFVVGTKSAVAAQSAFWGLQSTNTSFNSPFNYNTTNPDQQVDCVGVGYNTGETNLYIMHNDSSGACTRVNLGANFPVNATSLYRCEFWCATGSSATIFYKITRLDDGTTAEGELTSDLPTAGTGMGPRFVVANRATASAATLVLVCAALQCPA